MLFAALISAGNAGSRYLFSESSNGWLEIQWYMFAAMVLLGAPYTLKMNEHVRVDLVYGMVSERTRIWIDIVGGFLFLLPICVILTYFTWPWFVDSWKHQRSVVERRRADALAGEAAVAGRLFPDGAAGRFGNHQAHRRARARHRHRIQIRKAAAMSWISANLAPLMFAGMILFMLIGYPAAFSLAATGLFFGFLGIEFGLIRADFLGNLTYQLFGIISNDLLLAIPFFTFMGAILERCGLAEDLLDSIGQLFGPVRGGMSYAVIFVGAILGAITGTVAASVIAMGVISMTPMLKYGYSTRHTMGVIAASGTITQLIPPSLVLVVLADQLGRSVGDMYAGAIGPSLIQVALFCIWVAILSIIRPQDVRRCRSRRARCSGWALWKKCLRGIIPSLGLIFLVLGTIFMGLATPTEAGAMGVVGAIALAGFYGTLTWPLLYQGMASTMRITAMVVYILIGARVFSLVFQGVGGKVWIEDLLTSLPGGQVGFLIFVNVFIFVIAFFLDFFEIAFIIIPLLAPAADKLGIDLIWFGVLICANIQTSFMHPPFGFALFYLRGIAPPSVKTSEIYWGAIPWVVLQVILVAIVILWPRIGDLLDRQGHQRRPVQDPDRHSADRTAADPVDLPNSRHARSNRKRPRSVAPGPSHSRCRPISRAFADHEAVVGVLRDLEPLIAVLGEGRHRVVDLLELAFVLGDLGVQLLRRLVAGFHDRPARRRAAWRRRRAACAAPAGLSSSYFAIIQVLA